MNALKIEKYKSGQEIQIYQLIKKVYDEFVAFDNSDEGNRFFYKWIDPQKIAERQQNEENLLVALINSEIVGMIEIRDNNYITLLFVDKKFQGKGIAKQLFRSILKESIERNPNLDKFYVHASPYSIPIYKKLGFVETDVMQIKLGIKYLPMEMPINDSLLNSIKNLNSRKSLLLAHTKKETQ